LARAPGDDPDVFGHGALKKFRRGVPPEIVINDLDRCGLPLHGQKTFLRLMDGNAVGTDFP